MAAAVVSAKEAEEVSKVCVCVCVCVVCVCVCVCVCVNAGIR